MDLTSIEGLVIALIVVVPGGLGIELRSYLWSGRRQTPLQEALGAVAFSTSALLLIEMFTGLFGLVPKIDWGMGDFLANDLIGGQQAVIDSGSGFWLKYILLACAAICLPSSLRWLRKRPVLLKLKSTSHLSLESVGFEALFEESVTEAVDWDASWTQPEGEAYWLMVDTQDGHRFRGQLMWRSTAPDPPEIVMIEVADVTDSENIVRIEALLLVRDNEIKRLWVMKPMPERVASMQVTEVANSRGSEGESGVHSFDSSEQ